MCDYIVMHLLLACLAPIFTTIHTAALVKPRAPPCLSYEWKCDQGLCIPTNDRCDGVHQCIVAGDVSDEANCENYSCGARFTRCGGGSHLCVLHQYRCDGLADRGRCGGSGDDEADCEDYECRDYMVPCGGASSHLCVWDYMRCDGHDNRKDKWCGGTGGDEEDCENYECRDGWTKCGGASHLCLPIYDRCNGNVDNLRCNGTGEDEADCEDYTCEDYMVPCGGASSHLCVRDHQRCDGRDNRGDLACGGTGGDEDDCANYIYKCRDGYTACGGDGHLCMPAEFRCDGIVDNKWCGGAGSDETGCVESAHAVGSAGQQPRHASLVELLIGAHLTWAVGRVGVWSRPVMTFPHLVDLIG